MDSSAGWHAYGPRAKPGGSCSLIVVGGLVIAGYFNPTNNVVADDVILAVDAATGKTKWKQVYAGKGYNRSANKHNQYSPTPTSADGKVFHLGTCGRLYCVELATGKPLWETDLGDYPEYCKSMAAKIPVNEVRPTTSKLWVGVSAVMRRPLCNPLGVIGGVLMVHSDRLYAYDTATGKLLWKRDGVERLPSPAKIGGAVYALLRPMGSRPSMCWSGWVRRPRKRFSRP